VSTVFEITDGPDRTKLWEAGHNLATVTFTGRFVFDDIPSELTRFTALIKAVTNLPCGPELNVTIVSELADPKAKPVSFDYNPPAAAPVNPDSYPVLGTITL